MHAKVRGDLTGLAALALALASCGLGTDGLGPVGSSDASPSSSADAGVGGDDGSNGSKDAPAPTVDATGDVSAPHVDSGEAPGSDAASSPCLSAVPSGWSVVAYEASRNACASGLGAAHDEYVGATAAAAACTCTCQVTAAPDCTSGMLSTMYGPGPQAGCAEQGEVIAVNGGTCTALTQGGSLTAFFSATPLSLSGGACAGTQQGDTTQVTEQGVRYCELPPASAEAVCEGNAPAGFAACVVASGDLPCPGTPFTNKTVIYDSEMLVCSACTTCSVGGTCGSPRVTFYSDARCNQQVAQLAATSMCQPSNAAGSAVLAAEYSAQTSATCEASGSTASLTPQGPHTVCCR